MIDTEKYEGHTEGPWAWDDLHSSGKRMLFVHRKGNDNDIIANVNGVINGKLECANAQLIADAPLLLEAYKRLREENDELRWFDDFCDICNTTTKTPLHHVNIKGENYCPACLDYTTTNLLAEVKRLREGIKAYLELENLFAYFTAQNHKIRKHSV